MEEGGGGGSRSSNNDRADRSKEPAAADHEGVSEDEKMEKFYSLIRNYREALDRWHIQTLPDQQEGEFDENKEIRKIDGNKRPRTGVAAQTSGWIPAFEWEDFADHDHRFIFGESPSNLRLALPPTASGDNRYKDLPRDVPLLQPPQPPLSPTRKDADAAGTSSGSRSGNCDGMELDLTLRL